ncbi:basic region leucine zipper [Oesophagostomum dentatum]|uniref:Basic region leucine zipper n=1 Tax=Oesophagostomum dentatum TaxID=61180 RepID=A0A0B1TGX8_OESDE|nr:basic region leucine zipper [Oesophagostomum dentatum]
MSSSASMSCDELHDREEVSSTSSSPSPSTCSITYSQFQTEAARSAFRAVAGVPLTMQQRLLAMLQNEIPQPFASNAEEPCTTTSSEEQNSPSKKIQKDADYLERRRKNNDSARRSREVRRQREMCNRQQVEMLEKENVQLRAQIALLRLEVSQLSLVLLAEGTKPLS